MARNRSARPGKHHRFAYLRQAAKHPVQALVLVIPAMLALLTLSVTLPLIVLAVSEALVLGVLPRSSRFKTAVDRHLDRTARVEAAAALGSMLVRITDEHRAELEQLQRLAAQIRARSGDVEGEESRSEDWLGLGRLLNTYVRLAVAYRTSAESFRPAERSGLAAHVAYLETLQAHADEPIRPWIDRRLAIARRRTDAWRRGDEDRERIAHGLATISEIVRWMFEECATSRADVVQSELEDALASWEHNGTTLHELSALTEGPLRVDVDLDVLALCADAAAPSPPALRPSAA